MVLMPISIFGLFHVDIHPERISSGKLGKMKQPPKVLNRIVDKVLSYKPKPKTKKVKDNKDEEPKRD